MSKTSKKMGKLPTLNLELDLWEKGFLVVGIDEVGRGCFAGPLVVGGVIIKPNLDIKSLDKLKTLGIDDSKKLPSTKRLLFNKIIQEFILFSSIQYIDVDEINKIGIGKATTLGFERIAEEVNQKYPDKKIFFLTDTFKIPSVEESFQTNIIHGDSISISIATASIIAKVHRDNYMQGLSEKYPHYSFSQNKGYGTLAHRTAIKLHGACDLHRTAFIKKFI